VEPKVLLPCPEDPNTGLYPEPIESAAHCHAV